MHGPKDAAPAAEGLPEGWMMVPREPTPRMLERGGETTAWESDMLGEQIDETVRGIYRAMLSAAPQPSKEEKS